MSSPCSVSRNSEHPRCSLHTDRVECRFGLNYLHQGFKKMLLLQADAVRRPPSWPFSDPTPALFLACRFLDPWSQTPPSRQAPAVPREIPPELEEELFSRNRFFFEEGFETIRDALVIVVGLGGVGSHAAHMLVSVFFFPSLPCAVLTVRWVVGDLASLREAFRFSEGARACWSLLGGGGGLWTSCCCLPT